MSFFVSFMKKKICVSLNNVRKLDYEEAGRAKRWARFRQAPQSDPRANTPPRSTNDMEVEKNHIRGCKDNVTLFFYFMWCFV